MTTTQYGYYFHPPIDMNMIGYPQIDFNLFGRPTGEHFDPRQARLYVVNKEGRIELLTLSHPWTRRTEYQVCAGRINLQDHKGKSVETYTLGGRLTLEDYETFTHCELSSSAPIIDLPDARAMSTLFANQLECVLAHRQAAYAAGEFEQRLINADPLSLFRACLSSLEEKLCHLSSVTHNQSYQGMHQVVQKMINSLQKQGQWSIYQTYSLDTIL